MAEESPTQERAMLSTFAVLAAAAAFVLAALSIVIVSTNSSSSDSGGDGGPSTVKVDMTEFAFKPGDIAIPAGELTLELTNSGQQTHNLGIPDLDKVSADFAGGEGGVFEVGKLKPGAYEFICEIPGHAAAGMKGTLTVGEASAAPAAGGSAVAAVGDPNAAKIDFAATPPDGFSARDPNAPEPSPETLHEITLEARETILEVSPGVTQEMWTFNLVGEEPTVPGPILRGKIGDTFRVTLVNKGKIEHSIDFHASKVAWNDEMRSLKPEESLVYEFTADYAGAWMYHCGTAPALHHIGNGMYGAVIIDPPNLAPVDREFVFVQSELYTGPQDQPGDLTKMQNNAWDAVVFNGYVNQYKHEPIRVEANQRIRAWVIDDGPSENSSFHIVGTIFDTVYKEGNYLLQPDDGKGGSQALDLQPAQGGFVEFDFAEEGFYLMVTHKFSNVGIGALGIFQAGDVELPQGAGH
jgi:nitrite reductase (NO-forming)